MVLNNLIISLLLLQSMSVAGFRNLIRTGVIADDSFQPLLKKSDEYRKTTQISIDHFQLIVKNFQNMGQGLAKLIHEYEEQVELNQINAPQYYHEYMQLYKNLSKEQSIFGQKLTNNFKELTSLCNNLFTNFSNSILTFQSSIRSYKSHEQILFEMSKKYFRTHKNMLNNIQGYKTTFTDVKIIYNVDQKLKRFNNCENNYKTLLEELGNIEEKMNSLTQEKYEIVESYKGIQREFKITLKSIGSKMIAISRSLVFDFCMMEKIVITYLAEKKFTLEKLQLKTHFNSDTKINDFEYFNVRVDRQKCEFYPSFTVYHKDLKEESFPFLMKLMMSVLKENDEKIQQRKKLNKRILDFTSNYIKIYEKCYYNVLKQIVANFEKVKKKLSETFGSKLISFLKSIHSIFELSIGINEKFIKRTLGKIKAIQVCVFEQLKLLDLFQRQYKQSTQKFLKKKQVKKYISIESKQQQFTEQQPSRQQTTILRNELQQKASYEMHLIDGFVQKLKKNLDQLKFQYNALVGDLSVSTNQFYSLCCEYQQLYFGEDEFVKNYKKYQIDIDSTLQTEAKFFKQINFSELLKDEGKITFDSEISKVDQYKKLKKPTSAENKQVEKLEFKQEQIKRKESSDNDGRGPSSDKAITKQEGKSQNLNKYEEFLMTKITLSSDEKFLKSFSCALSDKILLSGRLYITNKRLCFHSKFNPNNVFFGDTFMQIPKQDITKVQKRLNAIVFDNSISVTTVNGQVFFTSFFSRNQAYDLICRELQLNVDEFMFEPQQIKDQVVEQVKEITQDDDIKEESLQERQKKIKQLLSQFPYKEIHQYELNYPNISALKCLKLFQSGSQITIGRKTFKSFSQYMREELEHKQYTLGEWTPNINSFLNSVNIKQDTPLKFTRKSDAMVPVANSGVPFMPKQAKSDEENTLYIVSKDKYIIESIIQNSGVPYADTFNIRMKNIIEKVSQNKVKITNLMYLNFFSNPMVKSIIESKSAQQTKNANSRIESSMKKVLNALEKKMKQSPEKGGQQSSKEVQIMKEQLEKEIEQVRQQNEKTVVELKSSRHQTQQFKKYFLISLGINIFLILILIR